MPIGGSRITVTAACGFPAWERNTMYCCVTAWARAWELWKKEKTPIFSMSDKVFGCGHASFFEDAAHTRFICYHAYLSTEKGSHRYVFLEPYRIEDGKVIIGNGSGKPADYTKVKETITLFS